MTGHVGFDEPCRYTLGPDFGAAIYFACRSDACNSVWASNRVHCSDARLLSEVAGITGIAKNYAEHQPMESASMLQGR
jgi:hypothetical protein